MANNLSMYLHQRPKMQTMDLLQWHSYGLVGRLIRRKTGGYFNHSGVVVHGYLPPDMTRLRILTAEAVRDGLMLNPLSKVLSKYRGQCIWYPTQPGLEKEAMFAAGYLVDKWIQGTPYDFRNLFKNWFGKTSADAAALFCSEAVFLGWQYAAIHLGVKILKHLLTIKKSPVPADMLRTLKIYQNTNGQRIL